MATIAALRRATNRPAWMEKPSIPVTVSKFVVLALVVIVMLFPFVYVLSVSLTSAQGLAGGNVSLIPTHPTLAAYQQVFEGGVVTRALEVSVGITVIGTICCMFMTTTLAYGLSRTRHVPGSRFVLFLVLATLFFSPGIIPSYLIVRYLGLLNTYASLILPGLIVAFNLIVVRQFFMNIPEDLVEAAYIDGANPLQVFRHVTLPLSKAVLAVIALFYGVGIWSSFFTALLYLNNTAMWPIQLVLRLYVLQGQDLSAAATTGQPPPPSESIQMAVVIVATVPILLVYPFLQRYFTQGVLSGAIKG
jgi:putative aldouronate transport system permease protein